MKRWSAAAVVLFATTLALAQGQAGGPGSALPGPTVPEGFGVNIHFTEPKPGEMERFAEAGYKFARIDLFWGGVEREKGKYDFSAYDRLLDHLAKVGARPLYILDYGNDLYQQGSPSTPEARAAFARFAAEAARHYAGKGVVFEIWNEPNIAFWKPKPNADDYAKLAVETARAVHQADPKATIIAPGSSGFPWEYFETVFQSGLLAELDGVSVHPYRGQEPEDAAKDFARLRGLIARYAPAAKRQMPIISSEWGYSTREGGNISEATQAQYIVRMWLANLASGVNLSIFYDWKDDGNDPKENEHRFGTVRQDLTPKPSFTAAKELISKLSGYQFRHRLAGKNADDWKLLFQKGETNDLALVTWQSGADASETTKSPTIRNIGPEDPGFSDLRALAAFRIPYGPLAEATEQPATIAVHYAPFGEAKTVSIAAEVGTPGERFPMLDSGSAGTQEEVRQRTIFLTLPQRLRRAEQTEYTLRFKYNNKPLPTIANLTIVRTDPLKLTVAPAGKELTVAVENPAGVAVSGEILLTPGNEKKPFKISEGEKQFKTLLRWSGQGEMGISIRDKTGVEIVGVPPRRYSRWEGWPTDSKKPSGFGRVLFVENVAQKPEPLTVAPTPDRSPATAALKFDYQFDKGWRYAQASPVKAAAIPANATALALWIYSDGSGDHLRSRFKDSTGQTFQRDLGQLNWRGWRPITIPLDGTGAGVSWGGANDRIPHGSLTWEGLLLIDSADTANAHSGVLLVAEPYYISGN